MFWEEDETEVTLHCEMCDAVIHDGDKVEWDGTQAYCESCTVDMLDIHEGEAVRCDMCNAPIYDGDRVQHDGGQAFCVGCVVDTMGTYDVPDEWDVADFRRKEMMCV